MPTSRHPGMLSVADHEQMIRDVDLQMHISPWSAYRRIEWKDTAELEDLFRSESLDTLYGTFLNQRFIDYRGRNLALMDSINWREFEGLTAEFFKRAGCHVEIGRRVTTTI